MIRQAIITNKADDIEEHSSALPIGMGKHWAAVRQREMEQSDKLFAEMSEAWDAECRSRDEPPDFQRWIMRRIADIVCGVTKGKTSDGRYRE